MNKPTRQIHQIGNSTLYMVLGLLLLAGFSVALYLKAQSEKAAETESTLPPQEEAILNAEPPAVKTVDMQDVLIQDNSASRFPTSTKPAESASTEKSPGSNDLFERGTRKIPLEDGLAGGSEAQTAEAPAQDRSPTATVHALDAFDYGVLDGRVRIGVFGKGPIPDYRVSLKQTRYVIDMPGEFRYLDQFGSALVIEQFGVSRAWLERS